MYRFALALFAFFVSGCSCSGEALTDDGGAGADGARVGEGGPRVCSTVTDCGGRLCDPTTMMCVDTLSCGSSGDCGREAYCEGGTCHPSDVGSPCSDETQCRVGQMCTGGFCGCVGEAYGADSVPPNMLIVLDRSGSMNDRITGGTKWEVALQAISDLIAARTDDIRFGLALYPGENQSCSMGMRCGPGNVFIDPPAMPPDQLDTFLMGANTCSFGTPTAEMLRSLVGYAGLADTTRPNVILLITDGQSTCDDPVPEVAALFAQDPPVRTFVVGFGDGVDPTELNDMAVAGNTMRTGGPPHYYEAGDPATLAAAFADIAGSILSCTYTLSEPPADITQLYVYVDRMEVPRDTSGTDGWDYDGMTQQITFYGPTCDALRDGTSSELAIVYGCPIILK